MRTQLTIKKHHPRIKQLPPTGAKKPNSGIFVKIRAYKLLENMIKPTVKTNNEK